MKLTVSHKVTDKDEKDLQRELGMLELTYGLPDSFYTRIELAEYVVSRNKIKRELRKYECYGKM
jgi:hypothetical protein